MMGRLAQAAEILPICGLPMTNALAEEEQELEGLVESVDKIGTRYDGDQCGEDQTDVKQRQWHSERERERERERQK